MSEELYKPLVIDFPISEELQHSIDALMHHLNVEDGHLEDCYREELHCDLKADLREGIITREQFDFIADYYVYGGIYAEIGSPWSRRKEVKQCPKLTNTNSKPSND